MCGGLANGVSRFTVKSELDLCSSRPALHRVLCNLLQ